MIWCSSVRTANREEVLPQTPGWLGVFNARAVGVVERPPEDEQCSSLSQEIAASLFSKDWGAITPCLCVVEAHPAVRDPGAGFVMDGMKARQVSRQQPGEQMCQCRQRMRLLAVSMTLGFLLLLCAEEVCQATPLLHACLRAGCLLNSLLPAAHA